MINDLSRLLSFLSIFIEFSKQNIAQIYWYINILKYKQYM